MPRFTVLSSSRRQQWLGLLLTAAACTSGDGLAGPPGAGSALYVLNSGGNSIAAYTATANGNTAPQASILGGGNSTGLYAPAGIALDTAGRLFVANCCGQILIFAPGATGNVAPQSAIGGNNTGLAYPAGIAFDPKGNLYVSNRVAGPSITAYAAGASGNIAPITTIAGANTRLAAPTGIAFDASGRLYVANGGNVSSPAGQILIYAAGASGNVAPIDSIAGSSTGLYGPTWLAFDAAGNVYVSNYNWTNVTFSITVYAPGAHGNAAPIRTITGNNTGLNGAAGIALDQASNLYVANSGSSAITVYAAGASGNATPTRIIQGSNTGLAEPGCLALDAGGKLYVVSSLATRITAYAAGATGNATPTAAIGPDTRPSLNYDWGIARDAAGNVYVTSPGGNTVTVYAAGASGHATPTAVISTISATNQTGYPTGLTFDRAGNLYVTNSQYRSAGSCCYPSITVFAAGAGAGATPMTTITGSNTGMNNPLAIALDAAGNLYVANAGNSCCGYGNSITVYAAGASGNATPIATLVGTLTGLNGPAGLAMDAQGNLYVANSGSNSITVYAAGASGNVAPIATIAGANTGLAAPVGITF